MFSEGIVARLRSGETAKRSGPGEAHTAAQDDLHHRRGQRDQTRGRTALGIGILMNSRGLMELVIINIGLQKGIIGPTLFAMLVLIAIVTTMMAGPLFEFVFGRRAPASGELAA